MSSLSSLFALYLGSALGLTATLIFFFSFLNQDMKDSFKPSKGYRIEFSQGRYLIRTNPLSGNY